VMPVRMRVGFMGLETGKSCREFNASGANPVFRGDPLTAAPTHGDPP
jgi:hypothetical protein